MPSNNVIEFPVEKTRPPEAITCMDCDHCTAGSRGLYCTLFKEFIVSESVAQDCSEFEPI